MRDQQTYWKIRIVSKIEKRKSIKTQIWNCRFDSKLFYFSQEYCKPILKLALKRQLFQMIPLFQNSLFYTLLLSNSLQFSVFKNSERRIVDEGQFGVLRRDQTSVCLFLYHVFGMRFSISLLRNQVKWKFLLWNWRYNVFLWSIESFCHFLVYFQIFLDISFIVSDFLT